MKQSLVPAFLLLVVMLAGCGKKTPDHTLHNEQPAGKGDPNKALYDSVMAVHDEVMPRMDDIYKITEALKDKVSKTAEMPAGQKTAIEAAIASLDQAGEGMMVWMRQFNPPAGTEDEQAAREYLKQEMAKVSKVRDDMLSAIEKGRSLQ